jgi:hypothetical protein
MSGSRTRRSPPSAIDGVTKAELILTVGYYNMVSRFLESARVPLETSEILTDRTPAQIVREGRDAP